MPELPEVDRFVDIVRPFERWTIGNVTILRGDRYLPGGQADLLCGAVIANVYRRGKYMLFYTTKGTIVCHNAMSGYWDLEEIPWTFDYVEGRREATDRDVRVKIRVDPPIPYRGVAVPRTLRFHDSRLFGSLRFYEGKSVPDIENLLNLGPEALQTSHSSPYSSIANIKTWQAIRTSHHPIKVVMLDQKRIAGIGNIYAAEICWACGIDPRRPANTLTDLELECLDECTRLVLRGAIERNLSYSSLAVYRRKICRHCDSPVLHEDLKGRTTWFCPKCQS